MNENKRKALHTREYGYDNIKFILIFFVVFGHFLEISNAFAGKDLIYRIIYSFHMPAFIFISGYFSKYSRKKIVFDFLYTYVLCQFLYQLFDCFILKASSFSLEITTPYWLLWYLLAMIFYYLLLPLFDVSAKGKQLVILCLCFVASLLSGYDSSIGYFLTLSRFLSFLPYFVMGYYAGKYKLKLQSYYTNKSNKKLIISVCLTLGILIQCLYLWKNTKITAKMMYGSYSYSDEYGIGARIQLIAMALLWIAFIVFVLYPMINRKIPIISTIGQNTLPVFILHGFIIKFISGKLLLYVSGLEIAILFTITVLCILGNPIDGFIFKNVFTGKWLSVLYKRFSNRSKDG